MAAHKTPRSAQLDDIKDRFTQALAQKQGRSGEAHTDTGSRVTPRVPVARKQAFRRKSG
ncbi:DUF5302 family protein [Actinokineospora auranticolor]|uniref:DUF5302 domain-containing protein n=1 Tax=Actinokineospora auranticolor TaxID=155976 RepID=A0A2S6GC41_9PSEU|nr:DUF5302 family protein [Actinokineospora auranticolor]PPK62053.1 hypothetical protein CLV40_13723 [Actinokineospora auranticolor]